MNFRAKPRARAYEPRYGAPNPNLLRCPYHGEVILNYLNVCSLCEREDKIINIASYLLAVGGVGLLLAVGGLIFGTC